MQIECYTTSKETTAFPFLRKSRTNYYANLDEKKVFDNKLFWKVIKPSLSDKSCVKEQINLVEKRDILKRDLETEVLNTFSLEI